MKKIQIIVLLALILILGGAFYWLTKDNEVSVVQEDKTTLSPTQVESIENIGQWEFLSVSDEELIDTIRRGFWGDDQLVRIYYGTLRLGIDMKDVKKDGYKPARTASFALYLLSNCWTITSLTKRRPRVSLKKANGQAATDRLCMSALIKP